MDVIRHHDPGKQIGKLSMMKTERAFNQLRQFGTPQTALALAPIQTGFKLFSLLALVFDRQQRRPFILTCNQ